MKRCRDCRANKPLDQFQLGSNGRPFSYCRPCKNRRSEASRKNTEDNLPLSPDQELDRLVKRHRPNGAEWAAIQRAAENIRAYLHTKACGEKTYEGETGWQVIEAITGSDHRRFHQLISIATLQQQVWEAERIGRVRHQGADLPKDIVVRVRSLHQMKKPAASIALTLGMSESVVYRILKQITAPRSLEQDAA